MCGLAGVAYQEPRGVALDLLARMAASLRHRGPDGYGFFVGRRVGLAHVRLSIVDIAGGAQPLGNENRSVVIVFNGEIYNHPELREELRAHGYRFRTKSDTEVLVHGYLEWGVEMLKRLNGQFAFALHDRRTDSVLLVRDRFGVRPLFYAARAGHLFFASEVKALFASGEVEAAADPEGLDEVFTFWAARPPRTPFRGVRALEPGSCALWTPRGFRTWRYHELDFSEQRAEPPEALGTLDDLLRTSVRLRMRADVPVGGYLSGGLDSSIVCALAAAESPYPFRTFSVTFEDPRLDESRFQLDIASALGSRHAAEHIGAAEIGRVFPDVVRHTETPLLRTAPAPLFLLSLLARENGIKVVLTGEGADEMFLGYDLFKETLVRRFCARQPDSKWRPGLFDRLYPYLGPGARRGEFWRRFFLATGTKDDPLFSHLPRFLLARWTREFYSPEMQSCVARFDPLEELRASLPAAFGRWSTLNRAAYLEMTTLLSSYLLSSQGDRVAMAHGVEGRFPFLDHRLFQFAAALPDGSKLQGLREKVVLRRWARSLLPPALADRPKQPYRAPDVPAFFGPEEPEYVREMLDPAVIRRVGTFQPEAVAGLVRRCRSGQAIGFRENQALVGILSAQLWHHEFFDYPARPDPLDPDRADVLWTDLAESPTASSPRGLVV